MRWAGLAWPSCRASHQYCLHLEANLLRMEPDVFKVRKATYINREVFQVFGAKFLSPGVYKAIILKLFCRFLADTWKNSFKLIKER